MSWDEYIDLFDAAQKKECKYRLFVLDGVKHRFLEDQFKYNKDLFKLTDNIIQDIIKIENARGILIFDRDENSIFVKSLAETRDPKLYKTNFIGGPSLFSACFWLGDLIHFAVYDKSISEEEFKSVIKKNMKDLNLNYNFYYNHQSHIALFHSEIYNLNSNLSYFF